MRRRAEELQVSQQPSISGAQLCPWTSSCSWVTHLSEVGGRIYSPATIKQLILENTQKENKTKMNPLCGRFYLLSPNERTGAKPSGPSFFDYRSETMGNPWWITLWQCVSGWRWVVIHQTPWGVSTTFHFFTLASLPPPPKVEGYGFTPAVCLSAGYLKKLWTDTDEIWWAGSVCDKDELIRCWWRSGSSYSNFFLAILHHWEMGPQTRKQDISKKVVDGFGRNLVDTFGVWQLTRNNRFNFGEDPNMDLDMRII